MAHRWRTRVQVLRVLGSLGSGHRVHPPQMAPPKAPADFNCPVSAPLLLYVRRLRRAPVLQRTPFPCSSLQDRRAAPIHLKYPPASRYYYNLYSEIGFTTPVLPVGR